MIKEGIYINKVNLTVKLYNFLKYELSYHSLCHSPHHLFWTKLCPFSCKRSAPIRYPPDNSASYTFAIANKRIQCYNTSLATIPTSPLQLTYGTYAVIQASAISSTIKTIMELTSPSEGTSKHHKSSLLH